MNDYLGNVDIDTAIIKENNMGPNESLTVYKLYLILKEIVYPNNTFDPKIACSKFKISMPTSDMYGQYVGLSYDEKEGKFYLS